MLKQKTKENNSKLNIKLIQLNSYLFYFNYLYISYQIYCSLELPITYFALINKIQQ